jgi:uncharacterized OB-fold protein
MDKIQMSTEGWKCPHCNTIWAPTVKSCEKCTVQEETKDTRKLLTENTIENTRRLVLEGIK